MPAETCLKCGHVNPATTGTQTDACSQCGAIYSRVKAAMASGQTVRPAKPVDSGFQAHSDAPVSAPLSAPSKAPVRPVAVGGGGPYIDRLRSHTQYPTFRTVVRLGLFFGYLLAVCALIGGAFSAFRSSGSVWHLLIGAGAGAFLYLLTRIWFELTVMIVDIADASVRTAENSEPREAS